MANQANTQTEVTAAQESTTLAKVEVDNSIFKVFAEGEGNAIRFTTTFDDAALFNAVNGGSDPVKKYLGQEVEVTDMLITSAELHEGRTADGEQDESTPIVSKPCVHFYTADGQHLTTLSNGIVKSAKNLISCGFAPSEGHSIVIKFRTIETKKGTAHTFDLIKRN